MSDDRIETFVRVREILTATFIAWTEEDMGPLEELEATEVEQSLAFTVVSFIILTAAEEGVDAQSAWIDFQAGTDEALTMMREHDF